MIAVAGGVLTALILLLLGFGLGVAYSNREHEAGRRIHDLLEQRGPEYALEISRRTGLSVGTVYVHLARMEQAGRVTSGLENIDPAVAGRPQRRFYRLRREA